MPEAGKAFDAMGIDFIALVDGDNEGDEIRNKLIRNKTLPGERVISLNDIIDDVVAPKIEDLFSQDIQNSPIWKNEKHLGIIRELDAGSTSLDEASKVRFKRLFDALNEAVLAFSIGN